MMDEVHLQDLLVDQPQYRSRRWLLQEKLVRFQFAKVTLQNVAKIRRKPVQCDAITRNRVRRLFEKKLHQIVRSLLLYRLKVEIKYNF